MSNCFLVLKDIHNELVRINANLITSYTSVGAYTEINLSGGVTVQVSTLAENLDRVLSELYFVMRDVE